MQEMLWLLAMVGAVVGIMLAPLWVLAPIAFVVLALFVVQGVTLE